MLADGSSLSVTRMAPSIPIHIQEYVDEIDANVLALDKYDMVLSMAWLNTYGPTVDCRSKSVTFQHDGNTITLQPIPVDKDVHTPVVTPNKTQSVPTAEEITAITYDSKQPVLSSVADVNTSLIKDDQQLIVREGVPGSQSPHQYSTVNTVLYIVLLVCKDVSPRQLT